MIIVRWILFCQRIESFFHLQLIIQIFTVILFFFNELA